MSSVDISFHSFINSFSLPPKKNPILNRSYQIDHLLSLATFFDPKMALRQGSDPLWSNYSKIFSTL